MRPHLRGEQIQHLEQTLIKRLTDQSSASSSSRASTIRPLKSRRPRIKVLNSGQSVSIIIPEGVKLPIIATIQPAGSADSQMSEDPPHRRSELSNSPSPTAGGEPGLSRGVLQAQKSESPSPQNERQELPVGFGLPFLARVSRGRLNVSEASVPPPTSSDISATGEVFIPAHDHPSEWEGKLHQKSQTAVETATDRDASVPETPQEPSAQQNKTVDNQSDQGISGNHNTERSGSTPTSAQHDQCATGQPVPNVFGEILDPIPVIRIQRPSTPRMATSLGTSVVSSGTGATSMVEAPTSIPVDRGYAISALPVGAVTSALPIPLPLPGLSGGAKKARRHKLIGKIRKHVIRKQLLALLLGREIANIAHPLLSQAVNKAGAVPL